MSKPQEVTIYHASYKSLSNIPELNCYKIIGENIDETALDINELEKRVLELAKQNPQLIVRNTVPGFSSNKRVTIESEDVPDGRKNTFRPLKIYEIPESIEPYINQGEQK